MTVEKTVCASCGRQILMQTAQRRGGLCAPCYLALRTRPPEELFCDQCLSESMPSSNRSRATRLRWRGCKLCPVVPSLCFFVSVRALGHSNGGISQLYSNSAWSMILHAEQAAQEAGASRVATFAPRDRVLFHRQGRSKHERGSTMAISRAFRQVGTRLWSS